ncbi:MAG: M61 family metallopeptidase [Armatimonadetes bacterium]|nr:M61 family metallopeptidase [Armatimonadota bacterium]
MKRLLVFFAVVMLAAVCRPAWYFIAAMPDTKQARVVVVLEDGDTATEFRMPGWAPGDYEMFNYGKKIEQVKFSLNGEQVTAKKGSDVNLWTIEGGANVVEYIVNESRGTFSPNLRVTQDEMFVSGPGVFGWFAGHADEKQTLHVMLNTESAKVACSLDPIDPMQGAASYSAVNYDELIDSPIVVGDNVRIHEFEVHGKSHAIVGYNKSGGVDLKKFEDNARKVVEEAFKLFGELPYDRYYFMFDFGGPGGGLEHLDSTRIGISRRASARQARSIMFHEYFHTFNVKRIRDKALKPFDYTKPAVTGALWWFEGVTSYYAAVFACRAGLISQQEFMNSMGRGLTSLVRNRQFLEVSAYESSRRVWEARGSRGYGISYYAKGQNVGIVLDLAIRGFSNGKYSLDNVMHDLYKETVNGPGFAEDRIRQLCIQYGGEQLGEVYDAAVMRPGPVPITQPMLLTALKMTVGGFKINDIASDAARSIGEVWPFAVPKTPPGNR